MFEERAECNKLSELFAQVNEHLDVFQQFDHPDAMVTVEQWQSALDIPVPQEGIGAKQVIAEMGLHVIPNGSQIAKPGCTSYITSAATDMGSIATVLPWHVVVKLEWVGKEQCQNYRKHNNHCLLVLKQGGSPCTHKTTGKHPWAWFLFQHDRIGGR